MPDILHLHHIAKTYAGGGQALADVSFTLAQGEMAFLTGHSGAGKSTLLKLIALIERPTRGQLFVNGKNTAGLRRRHIPFYRQHIGIIFQNYNLLNDRTVFDNVALPLIIRGVGRGDVGRRVRAALDTVGLLGKEQQAPMTLSGGEQQRVGIARAIVNKPRLILADEPTGNLDPQLSAEIMNLFGRFNELGVSLLIASHDIDLIQRLGCRTLQLEQGTLNSPQETD